MKNIQQGDEKEKNRLIQEYVPFITKTLSNQLNKYIEIENDDVFSIGLMAFNEAIDKYDEKRGSFLTFATTVIKSRVIDEMRREGKLNNQRDSTELFQEEDEGYKENIAVVEGFENTIELKLDMMTLVEKMKTFGVSLDDLIKESPKHKDTRNNAVKIAKYIYKHDNLKEKLMRTKNLPTRELIEELEISKKVVQKSRKFIITIVLILESDLDTLNHYIANVEGGESDET